MKYEYKVVRAAHLSPGHEDELNKLAEDGWRLVCVLPNDGLPLHSFVFERPKS